MSKLSTKELFDDYIIPSYARFPVSFIKGQGAYLFDEADECYLDLTAGIAVNSLGHASPVILKALYEQAESLMHCSNLYLNRKQGELAEMISSQVMKSRGKCFFCNSGAEANEALIKLSRRYGVAKGITNPEMITFHNSFHGRTMAGITATGQEKVKVGFAPLLPGFLHAEYNNLESVKSLISKNTTAILLEVIQGEGGVTHANPDFLIGLQQLTREHEILLMVDEVQAGLGRTGQVNSWEIFDLPVPFEPDAVSWAKGLGGGFPIGAIWAKDQFFGKYLLSQLLNPGSHGSTYGGNPLGGAVALAVLSEILRPEFLANVQKLSKKFRNDILALNLPWIKSLKGQGLMIGIEVNVDLIKQQSDYSTDLLPSIYMVKKLFANKLLAVAAGDTVLRLLPALNIKEEDLILGLQKIKTCLL